jgi:hypothetical protein
MKLMRVASIALAAYLVNSALRTSITCSRSWLRMKGAYSAHQQDGALVVGAHDDAVGAHEVLDRRTFLQELGVGHHGEVHFDAARRQFFGDRRAPVGRAHRHRALVDDHLVVGHVAADAAGGRQHVLQVGRAVLVGRRAHADELQRAVRHRGGHVGGELQRPAATLRAPSASSRAHGSGSAARC